jgi:hypothetical protein
MTEKKLASNRENARKSTGPKTANGKAVSSRNSVKHGVLTAAPILPGIESRKAWEKHRDGVFESIAPVGYLMKLLTNRLAVQSWRICRVVRYEAEVAAAAIVTAETDLEGRSELEFGRPSDPAEARAKGETAALIVELLKTLGNMTDGERLDTQLAVVTLWALWRELPNDIEGTSIPGIPDDDAEFNAFDQWTAGLLRKGVEVYAAAARMTSESLLSRCISSALRKRDEAEEEEQILLKQRERWKLLLERENRSRMLLEPDVLDKVARYESNLERSFFKTLHEIQRLQASRSGAVVPLPATMDVDLTVHTEGSS